jgi:peptidoglycan hydrolase CwlO-like protein
MRSIEEIQEKIFMAQDKIKWAKMFIAHAESQLHELQESIFDKEEEEWLERIARQNRT